MLSFLMSIALSLAILMSDFIWVEKYRPKLIDECILPDSIKKTFQDFVTAGEIPNMLLSSPTGDW